MKQDNTAPAAAMSMHARISLILLGLMFSLPFLVPHHEQPMTTFYGEFLAAGLGLLACSILLRPRAWAPFEFPLIALLPLGLVVIAAVQVAMGMAVYWQQHMLFSLYLGWAALMAILGSVMRRELGFERIVPVLAWAIFVASLISVLLVVAQVFRVESSLVVPFVTGKYAANLAQVNHLANYLALGLASLLYLKATGRIGVAVLVVSAIALLSALTLTGARMGWIYVGLLTVAPWVFASTSIGASWRVMRRYSWLLIPAFALIQLVLPLLSVAGAPQVPAQKIVTSMQGSSIRLELLSEAWQVFLAHPLLGAGIWQFGWHDFLLAGDYPNHKGWMNHSHNLLAQLMAETGAIGAILLIGLVLLWILGNRRIEITMERGWIYLILGVLAVHSLLEYPLWYAYFLGIAAFLLGMGEERKLTWKMELGPIAMGSVLAFAVFSMVNLGMHYYKLEGWYTTGAGGKLSKAQFLAALDDMAEVRKKSLLAFQIDFVMARALPLRKEALADKFALQEQVVRVMQGEQEVYGYAMLLALQGRAEEAKQMLELAIIRHPGWAEKFRRQAISHLMKGNIELFPLVMIVQDHLFGKEPKLKPSSSGKNPAPIRENTP
jgi:O-antigen ligase